MRLEAIGGVSAALIRVRLVNTDAAPHRFALVCDSGHWGENPAWMDPERWTGDYLAAGWNERADRVLILGSGAEAHSLRDDRRPPGSRSLVLVWNLAPGEEGGGWLVRPYRTCAAELPELRQQDWEAEFAQARAEWQELLDRASRPVIPDSAVERAFYAGLADLFIMREPIAGGRIGAVPGTEVYRAANVHEAAVVAIALDQFGLHQEADRGYQWCLEMQEPDGNWNDPQGWGHTMWSCAGFKAWAAMEHYRLTGDREYLAGGYPRLLASSRWQERERRRTRILEQGRRSLTCGLLPRGEGDAAARYLYATLNHGTPLHSWCEERGQEPGTAQCSGDRQHLWTPVAVVRCIRDSLVMEDGPGLHLARGTARHWLASGRPVGIERAPTHYGPVSFRLPYDPDRGEVAGEVEFAPDCRADWAALHLRLPGGLRVTGVDSAAGAMLLPGEEGLRWEMPRGKRSFAVMVGANGLLNGNR